MSRQDTPGASDIESEDSSDDEGSKYDPGGDDPELAGLLVEGELLNAMEMGGVIHPSPKNPPQTWTWVRSGEKNIRSRAHCVGVTDTGMFISHYYTPSCCRIVGLVRCRQLTVA